MEILHTQREALQRACIARPSKPMATVLNTLFHTKLTTLYQDPLIDSAIKLFSEHCAGATGEEILVPAHDSLEILTRAYTKWQADLRQANASAAHTAKM